MRKGIRTVISIAAIVVGIAGCSGATPASPAKTKTSVAKVVQSTKVSSVGSYKKLYQCLDKLTEEQEKESVDCLEVCDEESWKHII